ncbi:hypothetical protein ACFFRL_16060 [Agromyces hippuratus]
MAEGLLAFRVRRPSYRPAPTHGAPRISRRAAPAALSDAPRRLDG